MMTAAAVTTGTPLENNLSELWTMFQFITPGLLKSRLHFQNKYLEKFHLRRHLNALFDQHYNIRLGTWLRLVK